MTSTGGGRTAPGGHARGQAYGYRAGQRVDVSDFTEMPGAGDMWSTVDDLARFAAAFDAGEILTSASRQAMCTVHTPLPVEAGTQDGVVVVDGYGYAYYLGSLMGHSMRFHSGDIPGYRALQMRLSGLDVSVVLLSNHDEADLEAVGRNLLPRVLA